jgi:mono/diheme cytochrome c family protein
VTGTLAVCACFVLAGMTSTPTPSNPHATLASEAALAEIDALGLDDHEEARKLFNAVYGCAHCHGTDAVGSEYKTDLRYATERHGDDVAEVIETTIRNGRDGTAMPQWGPVIPDERIEKLKAFILSVQIDPDS